MIALAPRPLGGAPDTSEKLVRLTVHMALSAALVDCLIAVDCSPRPNTTVKQVREEPINVHDLTLNQSYHFALAMRAERPMMVK